jgi:hypothetical protein
LVIVEEREIVIDLEDVAVGWGDHGTSSLMESEHGQKCETNVPAPSTSTSDTSQFESASKDTTSRSVIPNTSLSKAPFSVLSVNESSTCESEHQPSSPERNRP